MAFTPLNALNEFLAVAAAGASPAPHWSWDLAIGAQPGRRQLRRSWE